MSGIFKKIIAVVLTLTVLMGFTACKAKSKVNVNAPQASITDEWTFDHALKQGEMFRDLSLTATKISLSSHPTARTSLSILSLAKTIPARSKRSTTATTFFIKTAHMTRLYRPQSPATPSHCT